MISSDNQRFLLNMPKNASSYTAAWGASLGWTAINCQHLPSECQEICVILRDPVDRWISGMAQYLNTYVLHVRSDRGPWFPTDPYDPKLDQKITGQQFVEHYNMLTERIIFDQVNRFDDHVWPQAELCADVCVGRPRRYIMMDQAFDQNISQYFGAQPVPDLYRNSGSHNPDQHRLQEFLRDRLAQRPELRERVIRAYADDYALIERVQNEMV